jgi:hypothetical protein
MALHDTAVAECSQTASSAGIADGQHRPVVDHHATVGALGAEAMALKASAGIIECRPTTDESTRSRSKLYRLPAAGSPAALSIRLKRAWDFLACQRACSNYNEQASMTILCRKWPS